MTPMQIIITPINTNKNGKSAKRMYKPTNRNNAALRQPKKFSRRKRLISSLKSSLSSMLLYISIFIFYLASYGLYIGEGGDFVNGVSKVIKLLFMKENALLLFFLWYECEALLKQRIARTYFKLLNKRDSLF